MSNAFAGVGAVFKIGNGASAEVFTAVAEVRSINGLQITADLDEVTNLDSTGGWREHIVTFLDGGDVTLEMNFTRDSYDDFLDFITGRAAKNCQIVMADTGATQFDFSAFCTSLGPLAIDFDRAVMCTVAVKTTGQVTLTT